MIQAVIFDLDGVIIDSEPIHFRLENQMLEELNIVLTLQDYSSFVGTSTQTMWRRIIDKHQLPYSASELAEKNHARYLEILGQSKELTPIPGISALIKGLYENNFKIAVASSSVPDIIAAVLEKFNLSGFFLTTVSGAELPHSKPHPGIFLKTAELINCSPSECLVIEDSKNGIVAAKAAGMRCIGFLNPNSGVQDLSKADVIIKSFKEISVNFIRNLQSSPE